MRIRKASLPKLWLMTDERGGDPVALVKRLPKGAGVVFRHYSTPPHERRSLFIRVKAIARRRRLPLLLAGTPRQARAWGADGAHHRSKLTSIGLRSVAVHDRHELGLAKAIRADLIFVSPVSRTRSHPEARALGPSKLGLLIGVSRSRTIALGGVNTVRFKRFAPLGVHGWAGIDAFARS